MLALGIILFILCLLFLLVLVWRAYQVESRQFQKPVEPKGDSDAT